MGELSAMSCSASPNPVQSKRHRHGGGATPRPRRKAIPRSKMEMDRGFCEPALCVFRHLAKSFQPDTASCRRYALEGQLQAVFFSKTIGLSREGGLI